MYILFFTLSDKHLMSEVDFKLVNIEESRAAPLDLILISPPGQRTTRLMLVWVHCSRFQSTIPFRGVGLHRKSICHTTEATSPICGVGLYCVTVMPIDRPGTAALR